MLFRQSLAATGKTREFPENTGKNRPPITTTLRTARQCSAQLHGPQAFEDSALFPPAKTSKSQPSAMASHGRSPQWQYTARPKKPRQNQEEKTPAESRDWMESAGEQAISNNGAAMATIGPRQVPRAHVSSARPATAVSPPLVWRHALCIAKMSALAVAPASSPSSRITARMAVPPCPAEPPLR